MNERNLRSYNNSPEPAAPKKDSVLELAGKLTPEEEAAKIIRDMYDIPEGHDKPAIDSDLPSSDEDDSIIPGLDDLPPEIAERIRQRIIQERREEQQRQEQPEIHKKKYVPEITDIPVDPEQQNQHEQERGIAPPKRGVYEIDSNDPRTPGVTIIQPTEGHID